MSGAMPVNPGIEITEGIISAQTKVAGDDGVLRNAKADNTGIQYQKASYSGAFYYKADIAVADTARRMEAAALKLRDCIIECETQDQLLGDVTAQGSAMAAGTGRGYSSIDISTLYFKNKTAGQNGTIRITGVRE